jgi:hypothetical protein
MCRYRDLFKDTALLIHQEDGSVLAYKFIFAFQSPMVASFAPLVWLSDQGVAVGEMGPACYETMLPDYCPLQFKLDPLRIRVDQELPIEDVGDVDVVPGLFYMTHERLGTHMSVVPWVAFTKHLPPRAALSEPQGQRVTQPTADLLQRYPWLAHVSGGEGEAGDAMELEPPAVARPRDQAGEGSAEGAVTQGEGEATFTDDALNDLFETLEKKRLEWGVDERGPGEDFRLVILGGTFTLKKTKQAYDAFQGRASTKVAEDWCEKSGLAKSSRYAVKTFGDANASLMARAWCSKMQHLLDLSLEGGAGFFPSAEDVAAWVEPEELTTLYNLQSGPHRARIDALRQLQPSGSASSSSAP